MPLLKYWQAWPFSPNVMKMIEPNNVGVKKNLTGHETCFVVFNLKFRLFYLLLFIFRFEADIVVNFE